VIGHSQRFLPDNTQQSQQTNNHAHGGIRTRDSSKWEAAEPSLRPHSYRDRRSC